MYASFPLTTSPERHRHDASESSPKFNADGSTRGSFNPVEVILMVVIIGALALMVLLR